MPNIKSLQNEICCVCGKLYKARQSDLNKTCPVCRYRLRVAENRKSVRRELAEQSRPKKRKKLTPQQAAKLDKDQYQINRSIDNKHNVHCACRIYKPGDPEFEEIASQITPIEAIPKTDRIVGIQEAYDLSLLRRGWMGYDDA